MKIKWNYGVTTCPVRRETLLPRTLASLCDAGFDSPHIFVDNCPPDLVEKYDDFCCEVTTHTPPAIRPFGSWMLAMWELWLRDPTSHFYAIFQDDLVTCKNLRQYLTASLQERCKERNYYNCYTFPINQRLCPTGYEGWFKSNQLGKGGVALVFPRKAVLALLSQAHLAERVTNTQRGHLALDGGVVTAMKKAGYSEMCHSPSLVQHTGIQSSMGNDRHLLAPSWRGEDYEI